MNEREAQFGIITRTPAGTSGSASPAGYEPSPHLLDLKIMDDQARPKNPRPPATMKENTRLTGWRLMLDQRIHLADLREYRSVSMRPRGLRDFPPRAATSAGEAVVMQVRLFFRHHPLADLTVLTLIHLAAVVAWNLAIMPFKLAAAAKQSRPEKFIPVMPLIAVPVTVSPWRRPLVSFALLAAFCVIPLGAWSSFSALASEQATITDAGIRGVNSLKEAGLAVASRQYDRALAAFSLAESNFGEAREKAGPLGNAILAAASILPTDSPISAVAPLIAAGRESALGGAILTRGLAALDDPAADPLAKANALQLSLGGALPHLELAAASLDKVQIEALPEQFRGALDSVRASLPAALRQLRRADAAAGVLPYLLGGDAPRRFLVVFQNNAELRPTGGFIGGFALVDVDHGNVVKTDIPGGGSYDLQGSLELRLAAPQPLRLINPNWEFQDANWFADFPTSAGKIAWFYEKAGGPTVDGVIALNARLMESLLEVTGPIEMPEYGKTIDSRNFWLEAQMAVEIEYDREANRPKQFLADLAPKVLERLQAVDGRQLLDLATRLDSALSEKDLLLWLRNAAAQEKIAGLGWSGAVLPATGDYLQVVHTNIAGQKTDLVMHERIEHSAKIAADGSTVITLTISRRHDGVKGALFTGVRNVDFLRVYVPEGSTLLEASGFSPPDPKLFSLTEPGRTTDADIAAEEGSMTVDRATDTRIFEESDKTVFGNWVQTDPGETSRVTLVYELPPGAVAVGLPDLASRLAGDSDQTMLDYSLLVQKQPGANAAEFVSRIDLPRGFLPTWRSPERAEDDLGRLTASFVLDRDLSTGIAASN